jgi:hypothetical protein
MQEESFWVQLDYRNGDEIEREINSKILPNFTNRRDSSGT